MAQYMRLPEEEKWDEDNGDTILSCDTQFGSYTIDLLGHNGDLGLWFEGDHIATKSSMEELLEIADVHFGNMLYS